MGVGLLLCLSYGSCDDAGWAHTVAVLGKGMNISPVKPHFQKQAKGPTEVDINSWFKAMVLLQVVVIIVTAATVWIPSIIRIISLWQKENPNQTTSLAAGVAHHL